MYAHLGMAPPAKFDGISGSTPGECHVRQFSARAELRADGGTGVDELEATATVSRELDVGRHGFIEVRHSREAPPALEGSRDEGFLSLILDRFAEVQRD